MRVKRIEKEINRTIIESNQVPDSVLDKARREMQNSTPTSIQLKKLYRRKLNFIAVSLACICMLLFAITTLLVLKGNSDGTGPSKPVDEDEARLENYKYRELTKDPIQSVAFYNQKYNTNFISLKNLETVDSYYYSKEDTFVMLEENYQYQDLILNLKIMNKNVVISYDDLIIYSENGNFDTHKYSYCHQDGRMYILITEQKIAYYFSFDYYDNYEEIVQIFYENC